MMRQMQKTDRMRFLGASRDTGEEPEIRVGRVRK